MKSNRRGNHSSSMVKEIICKTDGAVILVDDEDYPILSRFPWYRGGKSRHPMTFLYGKLDTSQTVYMHQIIMGGAVNTDHADRNVLNMQKSNLRLSTYQQNGANRRKSLTKAGKPTSSQYKGVHKMPSGKYRAAIGHNRKVIWLGTFTEEDQAALAYNAKATELFGEYACLNDVHAPSKG